MYKLLAFYTYSATSRVIVFSMMASLSFATLHVNSFILSHSRNCFPFIFTQQLHILSSIFSYNKLNYSISSLIHILGNVMNSYTWPRTHSSCIHKLKSSLYDGVSFPLYMFRWQLYMLILSLSGACLLASLYTL